MLGSRLLHRLKEIKCAALGLISQAARGEMAWGKSEKWVQLQEMCPGTGSATELLWSRQEGCLKWIHKTILTRKRRCFCPVDGASKCKRGGLTPTAVASHKTQCGQVLCASAICAERRAWSLQTSHRHGGEDMKRLLIKTINWFTLLLSCVEINFQSKAQASAFTLLFFSNYSKEAGNISTIQHGPFI